MTRITFFSTVLLLLTFTYNLSLAQKHSYFPLNTHEHNKSKEFEHHDHTGTFFIGGAINIWYDNKDKSTIFSLHPELGYLFSDQLAVGVLLGIGYQKMPSEDLSPMSNTSFKVSPFFRYYYLRPNPFNLYVDMGFGYNISVEKASNTKQTMHGWEIGLRPGACIDLTEGLCLCIRLGFIGWRNNYFSAEEEKITSNGFGIRFAPEEAMIGLELEI